MAKLQMKWILAMFLTRYEFDLVDKDGKFPDPLPVPNRNDTHRVRVKLNGSILYGYLSYLPSLRLGPTPWSYILLRLQEGRAVDG